MRRRAALLLLVLAALWLLAAPHAARAAAVVPGCTQWGGYPWVNGGCLNGQDINNAFSFNPSPLPPQNMFGQGALYGKLWLDTSTTPATLRECLISPNCSSSYISSQWSTWGTLGSGGWTPLPYSGAVNLSAGALLMPLTNGTAGTTAGAPVVMTAGATIRNATTTDTNDVIGICVTGCGTTGTASVAVIGLVNCTMDGPTTAGDFIVKSPTVNGQCHDAGASVPAGQQTFGNAQSTNASAGLYPVIMSNMGVAGALMQQATPGGSTGQVQYNNNGAFGGLGPLTDGQLLIGSTGNAAVPATLTAGPNVTITNGPGSVTIAASGGASYSRTPVGDTNYSILATDSYVVTTTPFTATRIWTLPAANSVSAGYQIIIEDEAGAINSTDSLSVAPNGTNTINGSNTSQTVGVAYGGLALRSDGVSKWSVIFNTLLAACSAPTHNFMIGIAGNGNCLFAQPAYSDLSGSPPASSSASGAEVNRTITAESIPANTSTQVTFDTVVRDDASYYSSNKFTAPATGWYSISGRLSWASNASGVRYWQVQVNGTAQRAGSQMPVTDTGWGTDQSFSFNIHLTAGDQVTLWGQQNSGGTLNLSFAWFEIVSL